MIRAIHFSAIAVLACAGVFAATVAGSDGANDSLQQSAIGRALTPDHAVVLVRNDVSSARVDQNL